MLLFKDDLYSGPVSGTTVPLLNILICDGKLS